MFQIKGEAVINFAFTTLFFSLSESRWLVPITNLAFPARTSITVEAKPTALVPYQIKGAHVGGDGRVNSANCQAFSWASIPNRQDVDLNIRILSDGDQFVQSVANGYREDLQGSA